MKKIGRGFAGPRRRSPAQVLTRRRAPPTVDRVADVDTATSHGRHVGGEIVALDGDIADARRTREKFGERRARQVLLALSDGEQFEVIVLEERDRVLGAGAGMDTADKHGETDARVGVDCRL